MKYSKSNFFHEQLHWVQNHPSVPVFINQKIIRFLVFSSWQRFRLTFNFCWWCGKSFFCSFDDFFDTMILLTSSVRKVLLDFMYFFPGTIPSSDWFQTSSISSQLNISEEKFKILLYYNRTLSNSIFERTLMFLPTSLLTKMRHLLHSRTVFHISYPPYFSHSVHHY